MQDYTAVSSTQRRLTVRGRGVASAEPDLVVLSFGVLGRDPSYSAAVEKLNERVEALRSDLEAVGVDRASLKTTGFDVHDDRRYDKEDNYVFVGYKASHNMRLELQLDRDLLNRTLGQVARSASEATVRISFDVSDRTNLRRQAMRAAVTDARETALVLAESSGTNLGDIEQIDYSFVEIRTRPFSYRMADPDTLAEGPQTPDIEPKLLEAEENVTIVWSLS